VNSLLFTANRLLIKSEDFSNIVNQCHQTVSLALCYCAETRLLAVRRKLKFLKKYCNSENRLRKLLTDATQLEYVALSKTVAKTICMTRDVCLCSFLVFLNSKNYCRVLGEKSSIYFSAQQHYDAVELCLLSHTLRLMYWLFSMNHLLTVASLSGKFIECIL